MESPGKEENEEGDTVIDSEHGNVPCPLTPDTKESKSRATTTPVSGAAPIQEIFLVREYMPTNLADTSDKFP